MPSRLPGRFGRLLLAFCCAWLVGCATQRAPDVSIHAWHPLVQAPMEVWNSRRTALYTYVLVGDIGDGAAALPAADGSARARAYRALVNLLAEVQAGQSVGSGDDPNWTTAVLARTNQFCIPAAVDQARPIGPGDYDLRRAAAYLNVFKLALEANEAMAQRLGDTGPFLLATRKPIGEIVTQDAQGAVRVDTSAPILLVDLSARHEDAVPAYVTAFKQAVRKGVAGSTVLRPLRAEFASFFLDANEAMPFVAEAYAGTRKLFE